MTLQPVAPLRPLTVAEYIEIGEVEPGYTELVEGVLLMSPSPAFDHQRASLKLAMQLERRCPAALELVQDIDVDLQLGPADGPGTVRRPDLVVAGADARARVRREGGLLRASEVLLVVEIVSPSSVRTDHLVKRAEYADAGVPHYWILDTTAPVSLLSCHLAGEFGYRDEGAVTGSFTATAPFPAVIDLDALG